MHRHIRYFDFLRGIAIIMVVGIHTYPSLPWNDSEDYLLIFIRQILNCAVPIFLALSAFFMSNKSFDSKDKIVQFWVKYIPKVYLPCLIWSIPFFCLDIYNGNSFLNSIFLFLVCGYSIYYFIALIIQFYLLTPLLTKLHQRKWGVGIIALSIISVSLYIYSDLKLPLILWAGPCVVWGMFYVQGIIISRTQRNFPVYGLVFLVIIFLLLQMYEGMYLYALNGRGTGIKASAFVYSFFVILLLFSKKLQSLYDSKTNLVKRFIEYIGKISFGIYLIHCYVISMVSRCANIDSWAIKWIVVILVAMCLIETVKIILPNRISSKYQGIL